MNGGCAESAPRRFPLTWITTQKLEGMTVRAKDGTLVGKVEVMEVDPRTWQITAFRVEASRPVLEQLNLDEPSFTGGRHVYIDTGLVESVDGEILLKDDVYELARLRWSKPPV
jgi:sporulation protein YlmC with PRC-barrel domain